MNLGDVVQRGPPEPWVDGAKLPWDEPGFSASMLAEHLSQEHDGASRRSITIDAHVAWIHRAVLGGKPSQILDLGCGPGLYTTRLARLGHTCTGIDFSPASVEYARRLGADADLSCTYRLADIRHGAYGDGYDLVMLIFGELNAFRPVEAAGILAGARHALSAGGRLLLEVHTHDAVKRMGAAPQTWRAAQAGLFSERPHLRLDDAAWDAAQRVATRRYTIVDAETGSVAVYAESIQAYTDAEYDALLREHGFVISGRHPALTDTAAPDGDYFVLVTSTV